MEFVLNALVMGYRPLWNAERNLGGVQLFLHDEPETQVDTAHLLRILREMWARTLCPVDNSTRNIAFGRASITEPSISMTPSLLAMASLTVLGVWYWSCWSGWLESLRHTKGKAYGLRPNSTNCASRRSGEFPAQRVRQ